MELFAGVDSEMDVRLSEGHPGLLIDLDLDVE